MPKVDLPGGKSALLALRMSEFRQLWSSGAMQKLQGMSAAGADLSEIYPLLAIAVRNWDCTDEAGNALDPHDVASYDELPPNIFMALMRELGQLVSGSVEVKN
jgi:hypothetical protein